MKNSSFIALQGSYTKLELALFTGGSKVQEIKEINKKASSFLIPYINQILKKNSLKISDLDFICADQGPGAFTSLRVTISTINGISFANKVPLIGIDGLAALYKQAANDVMLKSVLLNAYNNEVYFYSKDQEKGYKKIDLLLDEIKEKIGQEKITFIGNGANLHKDLILKMFKDQVTISPLEICSVDQIAKMALEKWNTKKDISYKLYPLYLKSQKFAIKKGT